MWNTRSEVTTFTPLHPHTHIRRQLLLCSPATFCCRPTLLLLASRMSSLYSNTRGRLRSPTITNYTHNTLHLHTTAPNELSLRVPSTPIQALQWWAQRGGLPPCQPLDHLSVPLHIHTYIRTYVCRPSISHARMGTHSLLQAPCCMQLMT